RKLARVVEPRIVEGAAALHLEVRYERIPVRHRAPACPRMHVDASKAERRRNQRCGRLAVRTERLAIEQQFGVELPRSPAAQYGAHCGGVDTRLRESQQVDERLHA